MNRESVLEGKYLFSTHIHLFGMPEGHIIRIQPYPYASLHRAWYIALVSMEMRCCIYVNLRVVSNWPT